MPPTAPARCSSLIVAATCAATLVATTPATVGTVADDRIVHTLTLQPDQALAIAITVGTIRVTGEAGRRDVRIEIARKAPSLEALARAPVDLASSPAGPRLTITQTAGGADAAIRTDVVVRAPLDTRLDPVTIDEGRLELRRLHGVVGATVARGSIEAEEVSGVLRLETTIGPVVVTRARLDASGLIRLRTFNGDVRLGLAAPLVDTRVMALALNGSISSKVSLAMKDGWGPRWGEATIGRPDRVISIDVVTGTIRIEAPGAP